MNDMIYDFRIHSLYYENQKFMLPELTLTIDTTLQMVFELETGKLIGIDGFLPLIKAVVCDLNLPECVAGDYMLNNVDLSECKGGLAYDLIRKIPQTKKYFNKPLVKYDKKKGIIQIGNELKQGEVGIKVDKNIICGLDKNSVLKCVYIIPTRFIGH